MNTLVLLAITFSGHHVDAEPYTQKELCAVAHKDIVKHGHSSKVFDMRCDGKIDIEPEAQAVYGDEGVVYE